MKTILLFLCCLGLCGCATTGRILTPTFGAAGGAAAGHALSNGSIEGTVAGAGAGALLSEGAWAWKTHADKKSFEDGYVRGRADSAKSLYRKLQDQQQKPVEAPQYRRLTITIPEHRDGGVLYEAQTRIILIAE